MHGTAKKRRLLWLGRSKEIPEPLRRSVSGRFLLESVPHVEDCYHHLQKSKVALLFMEMESSQRKQGFETLRAIKHRFDPLEVILVAEQKHVDDAMLAVGAGAFDYICRSEGEDRFSTMIDKALERQDRNAEIQNLRIDLSSRLDEAEVCLGQSPEIQKVLKTIDRIAPLPTTVLLQGESGTGKEVMARLIHQKSHLHEHPFVAVSLPSIPNNLIESVLFGHEKGAFTSAHRRHYGKFELADGGTIFLDEIGDLPIEVQSKLLRVIQEGEIERVGGSHPLAIQVRVIAASKFDLKAAVKDGRFRDDLFYRLNVVPLTLPPLRRLTQDIPDFVALFIRRYAARFGKRVRTIRPEALQILKTYQWAGNIRELENLIERIIAMVDVSQEEITKEDVPLEYYFGNLTERSPSNMPLDDAMAQYERGLILKALRLNNWSRKKTAQALSISYGILKYKIRKLQIHVPGQAASRED